MTIRLRATFVACLISIFAEAPRLMAETLSNFTDFAVGGFGTGAGTPYWDTTFSTVNTSGVPIACTLSTFGNNGSPLILTTNLGTASTFSFTIPVGGSKVVFTLSASNPGGTILEGYGKEICDNSATAAATYTLSIGGQPVTSVGVLPSYPADTFISPANSLTGFALVNIDPVNSLGLGVTASNPDGTIANLATMILAPGQHITHNLRDFFSASNPLSSNFQGSVRFQTTGGQSLVGLGIGVETTTNAPGFILSAIPNISFNRLASLSGTFSVLAGLDIGSTGTINITNIAPFDTGKLNATVSTTLKGTTHFGQAIINEHFDNPSIFDIDLPPSSLGPGLSGQFTQTPTLGTYGGTIVIGSGSAIDVGLATLHH